MDCSTNGIMGSRKWRSEAKINIGKRTTMQGVHHYEATEAWRWQADRKYKEKTLGTKEEWNYNRGEKCKYEKVEMYKTATGNKRDGT